MGQKSAWRTITDQQVQGGEVRSTDDPLPEVPAVQTCFASRNGPDRGPFAVNANIAICEMK